MDTLRCLVTRAHQQLCAEDTGFVVAEQAEQEASVIFGEHASFLGTVSELGRPWSSNEHVKLSVGDSVWSGHLF